MGERPISLLFQSNKQESQKVIRPEILEQGSALYRRRACHDQALFSSKPSSFFRIDEPGSCNWRHPSGLHSKTSAVSTRKTIRTYGHAFRNRAATPQTPDSR